MRAFRIILERLSLKQANEYLTTQEMWGRVPNCSIIHYTRQNPLTDEQNLANYFNWVRMIRPAGGGNLEDAFSVIERKKYSNEELLLEAEKNRNA
jgi:hypothetical protein